MLHCILFMDCSKLFRQLCHAYYLAHFRLLCIIFVGSVYQEVGPMVLVSALTVFLSDLSFQQFVWVLKGDNNILDALPKSVLLLEWNKMLAKKDMYIFEGKKQSSPSLVSCHHCIDCTRTSADLDQLEVPLVKHRACLLLTSSASVFSCAFRKKEGLQMKSQS